MEAVWRNGEIIVEHVKTMQVNPCTSLHEPQNTGESPLAYTLTYILKDGAHCFLIIFSMLHKIKPCTAEIPEIYWSL